jgi:hypothetical protein|tara:strand:+ start:663 stop:1361 length:699 start_codon:yes stop_codon:yes gene_type:complete
MSSRYGSNLSFNDVLFNVLLGFVVLFVLALLLINPITKKSDIPAKAEILIILEWDDMASDDIDMWVQGPSGAPISFQNKTNGVMHLDRDDLGRTSDFMVVDGERIQITLNREVVSMRGIAPGDYYINIHVYNKKGNSEPTKYTITLLDVNPYKEVYVMQGELTARGEIVRLPGFTLDKEGVVTDVWSSDKIVVGAKNRSVVSDSLMDRQESSQPAVGSDEMVRQATAQEDDI